MTAAPDSAADSTLASPPTAAALARMLAGIERATPEGTPPTSLAPPLAPLPQMTLARGRVHEVAGPARRTLAALVAGAAQAEGPVLWLQPRWALEGLCPQGLRPLVRDPGALILARAGSTVDLLWSLEEALRAGCIALALAELPEPPDLRQIRRLHLAAEEGLMRNRRAGRQRPAPLGLILAQDRAEGRSPGVESRWALHPLPGAGWRLDRLLARGQPPADWTLTTLSGPT